MRAPANIASPCGEAAASAHGTPARPPAVTTPTFNNPSEGIRCDTEPVKGAGRIVELSGGAPHVAALKQAPPATAETRRKALPASLLRDVPLTGMLEPAGTCALQHGRFSDGYRGWKQRLQRVPAQPSFVQLL